MNIVRVRLTPEAKRWLNEPVNPLAKPFLDHIARMVADAVQRDEAAKRAQAVQP